MFNKNNQIKLKNTQNFLQSKKLVSELIEESNICEDDIVIEIGGGMECTECEMSAPGAYDIDIEADDINVTDTATVIWEIA